VDWWQTAVVDDRIYELSEDYSGSGHPVVVAVYDEGQDYVKPTPARLGATNIELQPNQLLCLTGNVAYVAVGNGTYSASGFLASQVWTLRAVDIKTGKTLWTKPLPKRPDKSERLHFLAAKVVGGRLVTLQEVEAKTVRIVVRDSRTGAVLWDKPYDVDAPEPLRSEIAADDRHVYLGGAQLRKLRLSDGARVWATRAGRRYGPPTLKSGVVYAVGEGAGLTAVDADGGKVLWTEKTSEADDVYIGWRPIIGTRYAYYRNGLQLRALSLSTHDIALTYKTSGEQFYEDAQARLVLAVDADSLSAYPLK
jgi:outer membrane protein assembly factor BamB